MKTNTSPLEYDECVTLASYLEILKKQGRIQCYTHTAQETYTKSWVTKNKNKAMGVRPGIPDYVIVTPTKVLFVEMKRAKGGRLSTAQELWLRSLNQAGVTARACHGFDSAKEFIEGEL